MKKILIVDDEEQILETLSRSFSDTGYETITANNGLDALKLLEQEQTDLVISDMKMPLMDGYQLLSKVKEKYPQIIRISLSGYAENLIMFQSSLHNIAVLNIFKPWNDQTLVQNINKILEAHTILSSEVYNQLLLDSTLLPDMPPCCQKLLSLIEEDPDTLIPALEEDTVLSALLMDVAHSSIYGVMPNSLKLTVHYLGLHNLKCFLYWAALTLSFSHPYQRNDSIGIMWKHSCCTNKILLFIYEAFLHKQPPEAALFSGLLHNTGFMLLKQKHNAMYRNLDKSEDILNLETEKFGVTHQELGGYLLHLWDLPFPVIEAALYHHRPLHPAIVNRELVFCVHIAQHYAWKIVKGEIVTEIYPEAFAQIDTNVDDFEEMLNRYLQKGFS
jgi:CheY-like chemotaxis protein/HD-like signal output (HDOD) protein